MLPAPPSSLPAAPPAPAAVFTRAAPPAGWQRFLTPDILVRVGVVALAAFLRLFWLDQRPPHFDEGVNGWFTDQMQTTGFYHYDPSNYHGPLHFYVLFLFKCLFGRNLWALRLPVALVGILTVDWIFRFRAFFGQRVCLLAALAMTLSPGTLFFQRDAIHETWLVFFLLLAFWGICGLWQLGGKRHLWALAMGVTGAILTKETYLIHFACFLVALLVLWILEENLPSAQRPLLGPPPLPGPEEGTRSLWHPEAASPSNLARFYANCAPQLYRHRDVGVVIGVSLGLIVFFYSGNFFHWPGLGGLASTFTFWGRKAHEGEGHNKPFIYWTRLVLQNEPFAAVGLLACLRYLVPPWTTTRFRPVGLGTLAFCLAFVAFWFWPRSSPNPDLPLSNAISALYEGGAWHLDAEKVEWTLGILIVVLSCGAVSLLALPVPADWRMRLLAIYAPGTLLAYSLIPYKTPWCAISFLWPFFFAAAAVGAELAARFAGPLVRRGLAGLVVLLAAGSAWRAVDLNYLRPTDDSLNYVYVQTFNDVWRITEPLLNLAHDDPSRYALHGVILCGSTYPLPWMLGDFTGIGYFGDGNSPTEYRADFLLVEERRVSEAEVHLDEEYFKETLHLRPAQAGLTLYLRASLFSHYFPDREPEFHPSATATPAEALLPDEPAAPPQ